MKPNRSNRPRLRVQRRGFALVISLSLMVLLTVLAVGLLTLSAVSLRASGSGEARAEAEANARMALTLAIGELQTSMGPDQRVSARASSLGEGVSEPNMLGAWESWHWTPGSAGPNYGEKEAKFRRWLVSSRDLNNVESVGSVESALEDPISLIDPKKVGEPGGNGNPGVGLRATRVPLELSETRKGGFAWAVLDESLKAPIQLNDKIKDNKGQEREPTNGEKIAHRQAPLRAHPESILGALSPEKLGDPAKLVSLDSAVIAAELGAKGSGKDILKYQADVTPYSVGLLTDTANGGLKSDLTTIFESNTTATPNDKQTVYFNVADGAPRWDYLRSHYQLNKKVTNVASGAPTVPLSAQDLRPGQTGMIASPTTERLMPVIAKLQVMFSMVSHYPHIQDRKDYYNQYGDPKGFENYGAPHLVYDPVVTLYNPYDVTLTMKQLRVRVWDPPVLFGLKKNAAWLRPEFANPNGFQGLARFQIANEKKPEARRYFTLFLRETTGGGSNPRPGGPISLAPGEVKVFSPWIETNWTWGYETAGGYTPKAFFDWDAGLEFGNKDNRTNQQMGLEAVSGWNARAGLQADHLSYGGDRPQATRYAFEIANNQNGNGNAGWLGIKLTDTFTAQAKGGRTVPTTGASANLPDFRVDLLAGTVQDYTRDILRTYQFKMGDPAKEMSTSNSSPIISRTFPIASILQKPTDQGTGGKTPFALLSMSAKTTADSTDYSMPWLHNHPVVEGVDQNSGKVGNALDSYDMRLTEVQDFDGIEVDDKKRGYYGASSSSQLGVTNVPMFRVPLIPATSLGDLIPANLTASTNLPRVTHAFGNSRAHPLIPSGAVQKDSLVAANIKMLDHSYLLNDALWDSTYFSTIASFSNPMVAGENRGGLLKAFLEGQKRLLNPRFIPMLSGKGSAQEEAATLDGLNEQELSRRMASVQAIEGPFNVNSDSVEAWKAMLTSLQQSPILGWNNTDMAPEGKTGFPRSSLPIVGDAESNNSQDLIGVAGIARWAGFRALDDEQITTLATNIVKQIRLRAVQDKAPSLTLGEFVNRRLGAATAMHVNEGLIQKAILDSGVNSEMHDEDSRDLRTVGPPVNTTAFAGEANAQARKGFSAEGAPAILTQGDLLMALAPVITVRGDTFRIRAYGESRDPQDKVVAKAWCEAVVQRIPDYLDLADSVDVKPGALQSEVNKRFGRRFTITSFRWLSPEEV